MVKPVTKYRRNIRKRLRTLKIHLGEEIGRQEFKTKPNELTCLEDDNGPQLVDRLDLLRAASLEEQDIELMENNRINVAAWLLDCRYRVSMGAIRHAFTGVTANDVELENRYALDKCIRESITIDLVAICKKIDDCIEENGLPQTACFVYYSLLMKYAIETVDNKLATKFRVIFSLLISAMHDTMGPEMSLHILVRFVDDLDESIKNVKENPTNHDHLNRFAALTSFACYLMASKTCSYTFLQLFLEKIAHHPQIIFKIHLKRLVDVTEGAADCRSELEKVLAPYRELIPDSDDDYL